MDNVTAEIIGKKAKALKHCNKLLEKVEKKGEATVKLNCTGVELKVVNGDAMHLKLKTVQAQLTEEIKSYEIVQRTKEQQMEIPLPSSTVTSVKLSKGNVLAATDDELERKRLKKKEYNRRYYEKLKARLQRQPT